MTARPDGLKIEAREEDGVRVFVLTGHLSEKECGTLVRTVTGVIEKGARKIVVDVAGLAYLSSAGLGAFIVLCTEATDQGGRLILAGENPHVVRVVQLARLDAVVEIAPTLEEAVGRL